MGSNAIYQIRKIAFFASFVVLSSTAMAAQPGIWAGAGINDQDQLGANNSNNGPFSTPLEIYSAAGPLQNKGVLQLETGFEHACAITEDLVLACWGDNSDGEVGNGGGGDVAIPTTINVASKKVTHVDLGNETSCALASDNTAYCWGRNDHGQLGLGTAAGTGDQTTPVQVVGPGGIGFLTGVTDISVADSHACAVVGGKVYCWGNNNTGQLGQGPLPANGVSASSPNVPKLIKDAASTPACSALPANTVFTQVHTSRGRDVDVGEDEIASGTSCAATSTGALYCWGENSRGELGNGTQTDSGCPVLVSNLPTSPGVTDIELASASDTGTNCAIASGTLNSTLYTNRVFCWGSRRDGLIGDGGLTTGNQLTPVPINSTASFTKLSVGNDHVCGVTTTGLAYCWGRNGSGEFGIGGPTNNDPNPSPVPAFTTSLFSGYALSDISTGSDFTLAGAAAAGPGLEIKSSVTQMMGLPCTPPSGTDTVQSLFGTNSPNNFRDACLFDNSNSCSGFGWRVWKFNRSNSAAAGTYTNLALGSTQTNLTNESYWINAIQLPATGRLFSRCTTAETKPVANFNGAACSSANGCMAVDISTLWAGNTYNLVGNPLPYPVDWSTVRVCVGRGGTTAVSTCTSSLTPAQAQTANVMSQSMYFWDGTNWASFNSVSNNGNIGYFRSFFVNVLPGAASAAQPINLLIPLQASSLSGPNSFAAVSSLSTSSTSRSASSGATIQSVASPSSVWTTKFRVWEDARRIEHNNVVVGRMNGATNGPDALDTSYLPPASNNFLYVTVPHNDWGASNGEYSTDIRSPIKTTTSWPVTIKSSVPNSTVRLWMQTSSNDVLRKCRLIDTKTGTSYNPNLPSIRNNGITLKLDTVITMNVAGSNMQVGTRDLTWRCSGI